jgi:hypothetical protein
MIFYAKPGMVNKIVGQKDFKPLCPPPEGLALQTEPCQEFLFLHAEDLNHGRACEVMQMISSYRAISKGFFFLFFH